MPTVLFRLVNPLVLFILRTPLHPLLSRWFLLLTFRGRKSGRRITTPATYLRRGNVLVLTSVRGWWRNLVDGQPIEIVLRGSHAPATPEVVTDAQHVADALTGVPRWYAALASLGRRRLGRPTRAEIVSAAAAGRVVVLLRLSENGRKPDPEEG